MFPLDSYSYILQLYMCDEGVGYNLDLGLKLEIKGSSVIAPGRNSAVHQMGSVVLT